MSSVNLPAVRSVLLVDDEPELVQSLRHMLMSHRPDWTVTAATSGKLGLEFLQAQRFDAVVSDMTMPEMHGMIFLMKIRSLDETITRVALSGHVDEIWKAKQSSIAHAFLMKPCSIKMLASAIEDPNSIGTDASRFMRDTSPKPRVERVKREFNWDDSEEVTFL